MNKKRGHDISRFISHQCIVTTKNQIKQQNNDKTGNAHVGPCKGAETKLKWSDPKIYKYGRSDGHLMNPKYLSGNGHLLCKILKHNDQEFHVKKQ